MHGARDEFYRIACGAYKMNIFLSWVDVDLGQCQTTMLWKEQLNHQ